MKRTLSRGRALRPWMALGWALAALSACDADDLLVRPAPAFVGEGGLSLNLASTGAAASAASWSATDRVWVHVDRAGTTVLDTVLAFDAGQAETRLRLPVGTQSERDPVIVSVELRQGTVPLMRSITPAVVEPQKTVTVTARLASAVPSIETGGGHGCAVTAQGAVSCWGQNDYGQLGDPNVPWIGSTTPVSVTGGIAFRSISANGRFTCGLDTNGNAYCWGANMFGQLGNGTVSTTWPHAQPSPTPVTGGIRFAAISTGGENFSSMEHACAVTATGEAYCWGNNNDGQLGTGGGSSASPQPVAGGIRFRSISAGHRFTCGISTAGDAYCWGANPAGQLGDGTTTNRAQPVKVSGGHSFLTVDAGKDHACGVAASATVYCWGANWSGELGNGEMNTSSSVPVAVSGGLGFASVSAGQSYTCGVTLGGAGQCWGLNHMGRTGHGVQDTRHVPTAVAGGHTFAFVSAGHHTSCGVTTAGAAYCWGDKGHGGVGNGTRGIEAAPVAAAGGRTFTTLTLGYGHGCGLDASGAAQCWGMNWSGQLGNNTAGPSAHTSSPVAVAGGLVFASISAGNAHTCALTSTGAAYCWGQNDRGQLGVSSTDWNRTVPTAVSGGLVFTQVSPGWTHSCGVTSTGAAYCWGDNQYGQLGNGTTTNATAPVLVSSGLTFASVRTAADHSCGITTTGAAYCWGSNIMGQLGNGTTTASTTPVAVAGGLVFQSLDVAGNGWSRQSSYSCGVTSTGAAYCWGGEDGCRLGNGSCNPATFQSSPVAVIGGLTFSSIETGGASCALNGTGTAYCWGANMHGELGIGHKGELIGAMTTDPGSPSPLAVAGGAVFSSLHSVGISTCGLTTAGTVLCWGSMGHGEHGNGSVQHVAAPAPVAGGITFRS